MTHYQKFKAALMKSLLLLTLLTMVSTLTYGKSDNGKSKLSSRQNNGSILSQELDSIANDATLNGDKTVDVIIQFRDLPSETDNKSVKAQGGVHKGQLHLINGNLYTVPVKALKSLAKNPNISEALRAYETRRIPRANGFVSRARKQGQMFVRDGALFNFVRDRYLMYGGHRKVRQQFVQDMTYEF